MMRRTVIWQEMFKDEFGMSDADFARPLSQGDAAVSLDGRPGLDPAHREAIAAGNVDEERRLMYVGVTRAQKSLHLSYCRKRRRAGVLKKRSRTSMVVPRARAMVAFSTTFPPSTTSRVPEPSPAGAVSSRKRETEAMADGSDAVADWPILNALLNATGGASWVSVHHGGGVGMGLSIHAGMVMVCDGTKEAGERILRVLTTDPGTGIMRHVDAGYDIAVDAAKKFGIKIPMMK